MPSQTPGLEGGTPADTRKVIDQLQHTVWEARAQLHAVETERTNLAARFEEAQRINNDLRSRMPETPPPKRAAPPKAEPDPQLTNLRQARDSAQATVRDLSDKLARAEEELEQLREQVESAPAVAAPDPAGQAELNRLQAQQTELATQISLLQTELAQARAQSGQQAEQAVASAKLEIAALLQQREEVLVQLEIVAKEVLGLRVQLAERNAEAEARRTELTEAARRLAELELSIAPLRAERTAAQASLDEALTSLASAQKQIERIIRDRDEMRESARQQNLVLEKELEQKRAQVTRLETAAEAQEQAAKKAEHLQEALDRAEAEKTELAERFEAQRLQTIDLAARLEAEQHQIRLLSSRLAESRLQFKASGGRMDEPAEPRPPAPAAPAPVLSEAPHVFDTARALDAIRAMRRCYHAFAKAPDDLSHLNELHCQIHALAEHASTTGFIALHRLVAAFDTFIQELYHFPEQITPTSLHTVPQTIEFLASLMKMKDLRELTDAATTTVYIVEDDPLTCECITMAMETSMMRGLSSQDPAHAACALASTPCDLIFLDINMPGMDGFELCSEIRQFALHRDTPIIFLSGMATPELRARAELVGGSDFLAKPFILCELTLKALVHIAKAHLHMA